MSCFLSYSALNDESQLYSSNKLSEADLECLLCKRFEITKNRHVVAMKLIWLACYLSPSRLLVVTRFVVSVSIVFLTMRQPVLYAVRYWLRYIYLLRLVQIIICLSLFPDRHHDVMIVIWYVIVNIILMHK